MTSTKTLNPDPLPDTEERTPTLVYGEDWDRDEFGNPINECPRNPAGTGCHYSWRTKWRACIFCDQESGL